MPIKPPRIDGKMLQQIARKLHTERLFKQMEDIEHTLGVIGKGVYDDTTRMLHQRIHDLTLEIQRLAERWGM